MGARNQHEASSLIGTEQVAEFLKCSTRTVSRLRMKSAFPLPIHVGRLVRWHRHEIESWIAAGCPTTNGSVGNSPIGCSARAPVDAVNDLSSGGGAK